MTKPSILEQFAHDGYVVLRNVLDREKDLQPVFDEYEHVLDALIDRWCAEGRLTSKHEGLPFGERLTRAVGDARLPYDRYFDISLPQSNVSEGYPIHLGPAVFQLLRSPRLLDAVEQFVGPEIYSAPIQHARIKLPESRLPAESRTGLTGSIGWHQDLATVTEEADNTELLTVWFPMTMAEIENGCLAVVPGSHHEGLSFHCRMHDQVCIPDRLLNGDHKPLPMRPGDVLMMHRATKHAGLPNRSNSIRWSFDLRYQPLGQPSPRPWFPGFIARSRSQPESELRDADQWAQSWRDTRGRLARGGDVSFYRWKKNDPQCA